MDQRVKNLPANANRTGFNPWVEKIPWKREERLHSRTLAWRMPQTVYSPGGRQEMDTTERLSHHGQDTPVSSHLTQKDLGQD